MSSPKCKFKENHYIICNIQNPECHRCGWNPDVAEERKKELRLRLTPSSQTQARCSEEKESSCAVEGEMMF